VQATVKAHHLVKNAGGEDITKILSSGPPSCSPQLVAGTDVTHLVMKPEEESESTKAPSAVAFQKAALVTFQTWSSRSPGICGLLMGGQVKNKPVCHSVIVSKSLPDLLADQKIDHLCTSEQLVVRGIIIAGCFQDQQDLALAVEQFGLVRAKYVSSSVCVFASWMCNYRRFDHVLT